MTGRYLLLGMIAGLIAGVLAFGVGKVWGEPPVAAAIAIEEAGSEAEAPAGHDAEHSHDAAAGTVTADSAAEAEPAGHSHSHGDEEGFSRETQAGLGLLTGMAVFGAGLGGLFALAFAFVQGRFSHLSAAGTAAVMAALGYVAVVLVPFLKYPANPPAVGHGETIGLRTQVFFAMMVLSLVALAVSVAVARSGSDRWRWGILGGVVYLALVTIAGHVLPAINEVPATFPGDLLWQFRIVSLVVEAVLWAGIGLIFGQLVQRTLARDPGLRQRLA
ncbi:CbtA family protein [Paracoccus aminovorans]|uniref:CbtA family protein n=1 Tax=Paracoccus aminovorans TaxID=34004 RepID=UPI002B25D3D4|nr:CbtA family protein [Paracoccus aminovorans]